MKVRPIPQAPLDVCQRYTPEQAAEYLRISRWSVFNDLRDGRLLSIKEGKRRFIPGSEIARRSRIEQAA